MTLTSKFKPEIRQRVYDYVLGKYGYVVGKTDNSCIVKFDGSEIEHPYPIDPYSGCNASPLQPADAQQECLSKKLNLN